MNKEYHFPYIFLSIFAVVSFISLAAGNVALGLCSASFLVYCFREGFSIKTEYMNYAKTIAFFLCTMLLSAIFSGNWIKGVMTWIDLWVWRMMPFVIVLVTVQKKEESKKVLIFSLIGIFIGMIYLIYQGVNGNHRASGFFGHAMTFAGYLCLYIPVFLTSFLNGNILKRYNWTFGILFIMGCISIVLNGTRGAWIALIPVVSFILFYYIYRKKMAALTCILFICIGVFALSNNNHVIKRFSTITDTTKIESNTERILMWKSAWNMFLDHPVLGVGLGQYKDNFHNKYILPEAKQRQNHAHNNFMQMLAENGLIGFIGFMTMITFFVVNSFKRFIHTSSPYALMISMSILALVLQGLTEYNFGNSAVMKCMWLLLGCLVVLEYGNEDKS